MKSSSINYSIVLSSAGLMFFGDDCITSSSIIFDTSIVSFESLLSKRSSSHQKSLSKLVKGFFSSITASTVSFSLFCCFCSAVTSFTLSNSVCKLIKSESTSCQLVSILPAVWSCGDS